MLACDSLAYPPIRDFQFPRRTPAINAPTPVYDHRGRQQHFIESSIQRKERIQFLKQREWARRVADWVRESSLSQDPTSLGRSRPLPPLPALDAGYMNYPFSSASVIPFPRVEPEEPYIIYSSSPSSSLSSLSEDTTPMTHSIDSTSPTSSYVLPQPTQKRAVGHQRRRSSASMKSHTRRPSLSSIFEVPEED